MAEERRQAPPATVRRIRPGPRHAELITAPRRRPYSVRTPASARPPLLPPERSKLVAQGLPEKARPCGVVHAHHAADDHRERTTNRR